jgi:acyl-CoA dehydrogenase
MDFAIPRELEELSARVRSFVDQEVLPLEKLPDDPHHGIPKAALDAVRAKARAAGLFAPQLPKELGGLGLDLIALSLVFEQAGRSMLGPLALHCSAPDEGNMHLLHKAATPAQKGQWLLPLARGEIRSCFAMTEPAPGAGSDPTMLTTTAERRGSSWVIHGHKWFTTGADGAAFAIVAAVTDAKDIKRGVTLFLVDGTTKGFTVVRQVPVMGSGGPGGHCEVRLEGVEVGDDAVLGGVGAGYKWMQLRLGPARLTHCMRWIGAAQRALEFSVARARERTSFGERLADKQGVQFMLADSDIDLHASRMMTLHAAWKIQQGDEARRETSLCKVFVDADRRQPRLQRGRAHRAPLSRRARLPHLRRPERGAPLGYRADARRALTPAGPVTGSRAPRCAESPWSPSLP